MNNKIILRLLIIGIILFSGCTKTPVSNAEQAKLACIRECQKALGEGRDLSDGPCLSDEITEDWVCDVAHSPRQPVDNDPGNQCESFRKGQTHHFVEVDPSCNFIRAY